MILLNNIIMSYFNYHAKAKNKIKQGKIKTFYIAKKWNVISPALILEFTDDKPMPIRKEHWQEYIDLIKATYQYK